MTPGIRVGQTYRDLDKHSKNRTVRIDAANAIYADATILTDDRGPHRVGRKTSIPVARIPTGWQLLADAPDWEVVVLDGRHEWWGIRHIATARHIARWDGTPARWTSKALADEDAAALGRGEKAVRSLDILAAGSFWACPKPDCDTPRSEPGDCPVHEIPMVEIGANGYEVT